jgi:hypothetical protein
LTDEEARDLAIALVTARISWGRELGTKGFGGRAGDPMARAFADVLAPALNDPEAVTAVVTHLADFVFVLCALDDEEDDPLAVWRDFVDALLARDA